MRRVLPLLLLCAAAHAAEVVVPPAPLPFFADTESVTNVMLPAAVATARLLRCSVELAASASNCVEIAFGRDTNGDGALANLPAQPPSWLFSREWDTVRLAVRGFGPRDESVSVWLDADASVLILR